MSYVIYIGKAIVSEVPATCPTGMLSNLSLNINLKKSKAICYINMPMDQICMHRKLLPQFKRSKVWVAENAKFSDQ